MRLFRWIKRLFTKKTPPPIEFLTVIVEGKAVQGTVVGYMGMRLLVALPLGVRLISQHQAVSQEEFARIWKYRTRHAKYAWEDGTPYSLN